MATMRAKIVEEMNMPTTPPPPPSVPSDPEVDGTLPPQPDKQHRISVKVRGNTGGLDPHNVPSGMDFSGLENVVIDLSQVRDSCLTFNKSLFRRTVQNVFVQLGLSKRSEILCLCSVAVTIRFQTTTQRPSITFSPEDDFATSINSLFAMTTPTPLVTTTVSPTRKEVLELIGGATEVAQISDLSNIPGQMQGSV